MCGLVIAPQRYEKVLAALSHRGVRNNEASSEEEFAANGWIGHARLPIVGLGEENDQPVRSGRWLIAFVGEVLDFQDRDPWADCDLRTVVRTFTQFGARGFRTFDGFWSVAALDTVSGDIHLVVDYLCQKPLYYRTDLRIAASEPYAVSLAGPVTPDEIYFSAVMKWGYCPETWRTPYREIRKMLPGEYVVMKGNGGFHSEIVDPLTPLVESATHEELKEEIELAVKRRVLSSDVPVAALVSGGLDSAIVYTLAKRYGDVRAYHVDNDEAENAEKVTGGSHTNVTLAGVSLVDALEIMQEPIDLGSLFPQVALSRCIPNRVCLTGDGADEFFGGYGRALRYDSQASDVWHELVAWHLPRLDRVMMRERIEVRSPFLARRVCQLALGLPYSMRRNKSYLRSLFRGDLPAGVADTPKRALRTATIEGGGELIRSALIHIFRGTTWGLGRRLDG